MTEHESESAEEMKARPVEHQVAPLMAAGGVEDGVLAGEAGSDPMADPVRPADEELADLSGCSPMVKPAAGVVAALIAVVIAVFGFGLLSGDGSGSEAVNTVGGQTTETDLEEESEESEQAATGDAASGQAEDQNATTESGASSDDPGSTEPVSFMADGIGDFRPVSADGAAAAAGDGLMIVADGDPVEDMPVEVSDVSVEVDGSMIEATVTVEEASGPFGVSLILATEDDVVVATNTVQAVGGPDGVEQVGQVTAVQSGGFSGGGSDPTMVVHFSNAPDEVGRTIRVTWDLFDTGVPVLWEDLFRPDLQLWFAVDGVPPERAEFEQVGYLRASLLISTVYFEAASVFPPDQSAEPMTLAESRLYGFARAGLPEETASCLVDDIPLRVEILVSFRPAQQEPLLIPCLLRTQFFTSVAAEGLQSYVLDGTLDIACLSEGMAALIPDVATYVVFATSDYAGWPPGLVESYAEVLEVCVPLEPFYLAQFGQYNFIDPGCPATMTNHVLVAYSWLRFIQEGILSPDPVVQAAGQGRFDQHVNEGYGIYSCAAAG